jgi:hypothetical protein
MRLPTNSTVSFKLACIGAKRKASKIPAIIIGIPMPKEIRFEVISLGSNKNLYEFYVILYHTEITIPLDLRSHVRITAN